MGLPFGVARPARRVSNRPGRSVTTHRNVPTRGRDDEMRLMHWNPRERAAGLVSVTTDGWRGEIVTPLIPRDPTSPLRSALLNERAERLGELRILDFRVYDTVRVEETGPGDSYRIIDRFKIAIGVERPA